MRIKGVEGSLAIIESPAYLSAQRPEHRLRGPDSNATNGASPKGGPRVFLGTSKKTGACLLFCCFLFFFCGGGEGRVSCIVLFVCLSLEGGSPKMASVFLLASLLERPEKGYAQKRQSLMGAFSGICC